MPRHWVRSVPALSGVTVMLIGLLWDASIHAHSAAAHHEVSLLDFSNPGHVLFGAALILTVLSVLADFSLGWITAHPNAAPWRGLLTPVFLTVCLGVLGLVTFTVMARAA